MPLTERGTAKILTDADGKGPAYESPCEDPAKLAEEHRLLNPKLAWMLGVILVCMFFGFWLGADYVDFQLQVHPIHHVDPKAQYVWIGDLLPRNRLLETAIVGAGFGLAFGGFVTGLFLIAREPKGTDWLKTTAFASLLLGISVALTFGTWLGYGGYLGEIRDWEKNTMRSSIPNTCLR